MKSVWAIGMLSQGHMVAPLYHYTVQVGPRCGDSGSLAKCKWSHNVMVEADINFSMLQTSIADICKVFEPLVCCLKSQGHMGAPLYHYNGQVSPRFGDLGSLVEWKWCHNVIVEADVHLRPLHTSMVDIFKVFESLVCCLKGIWVHPYTVTLAKLAPDLGIQGHLRCGNDLITSWLRLIFTSDCFIHPY